MKKTIAIILSLVMLLSTFSMLAMATEPAEITGNGTEAEPYMISSVADWAAIGTSPYTLDKHYKLANDIGSEETPVTTMIGSYANRFTGTFDGNGKTIYVDIDFKSEIDASKLYSFVNADYVGLFACVGNNGAVKNLTVDGTMDVVTPSGCIGGVVGATFGNVTVSNVTSKVTLNATLTTDLDETEGADYDMDTSRSAIGGVVGRFNANHSTTAEVTGWTKTQATANLTHVFNMGNITITDKVIEETETANKYNTDATKQFYVDGGYCGHGGIAGFNSSYVTLTMNECANFGDITQTGSHSGLSPMIGQGEYMTNTAKITLTDSINYGTVTRTTSSANERAGAITSAQTKFISIERYVNLGDVLSNKSVVGFFAGGNQTSYMQDSLLLGQQNGIYTAHGTQSVDTTVTNGKRINIDKCVRNVMMLDQEDNTGCVRASIVSPKATVDIDTTYAAAMVTIDAVGSALKDKLIVGYLNGEKSIYFTWMIEALGVTATGTEAEPDYTEITSVEQLLTIGAESGLSLDGNYKLADSFNDTTAITAGIGSYENPFTGTFDGNGKTLNLNIVYTSGDTLPESDPDWDTCDNVGLFNVVENATIKNLNLAGTMDVTMYCGYAGALIGAAYGDCFVKNCTTDVTITAKLDEVAYDALHPTEENVTTTANISKLRAYTSYVAGMVGIFNASKTASEYVMAGISDCVNYGNVTADSAYTPNTNTDQGVGRFVTANRGAVAGLVGHTGRQATDKVGLFIPLTMVNCVNYGDLMELNATSRAASGLFGNTSAGTHAYVTMIECANYGDISKVSGNSGDGVAGLSGYARDAIFYNCFNAGNLSMGTSVVYHTISSSGGASIWAMIGCFGATPGARLNQAPAKLTVANRDNYVFSNDTNVSYFATNNTTVTITAESTQQEILNALSEAFKANNETAYGIWGVHDVSGDLSDVVGFDVAPKSGVAMYGWQVTDAGEENAIYPEGHAQAGQAYDAYNIRFVATVDMLSYEKVGYTVTMTYFDGEKNVTMNWPVDKTTSTTVYTKLTGSAEGQELAYEAVGCWMVAIAITDVPVSLGEVTFTVTPWSQMEGEDIVYGTPETCTHNPGAAE